MIIHMWMHWFWITTSSLECFLFFAVQMISLTCISHPLMSEAGLLDNNISTHFDFEKLNNSSQVGLEGGGGGVNITTVLQEEVNVTSEEVTTEALTVSSITETTVENLTSETGPEPRSDEHVFLEESSDAKDTYNGDSLEVFPYPMKKVGKYSQIKYAKKTKEESGEEEKKAETVNVIEEKVKINISLQENVGEKKESSESSEVGTSTSTSKTTEPVFTEAEPAAAAVAAAAAVPVENVTLNEINATEPAAAEESAQTAMTTATTSSPPSQHVTNTSGIAEVTEDQKDADLKNETLVIENKVEERVIRTTVEPFIIQNRVAAATSAHSFENDQAKLNAGSITGITLGILVVFSLFGAVSFVLYRRRYLNKPQVLHDKCSNLDSSGYIDDTSLREHSEEMYSLDNDSFLNSLEAMTIQNYWTENVKHTKL